MEQTELNLAGFKPISYTEMIELIIEKKEIILACEGMQLYWKPRRSNVLYWTDECYLDGSDNLQANT